MKKRMLIALSVWLLLSACGKNAPAESVMPYSDFNDGCVIGDRFYSNFYPLAITVYSPDGTRRGLCIDPLCKHDGSDGICPDYTGFIARHVLTDGERLYLAAQVYQPETGSNVRQIYSLSLDGTDFHLISSHETDGRNSVVQTAAGELWFEESKYDEDAPEGERDYAILCRVPSSGGQPDVVTDERYPFGVSFAVRPDGKELALIRFSRQIDANAPLTSEGEWVEIIDRETGEKTVIAPPALVETMDSLRYFEGSLWLTCSRNDDVTFTRENGEEGEQRRMKTVLYRLEGEQFVCMAVSEEPAAWGPDAVWYLRADYEYLGTKAMPTGRPGEQIDYDYIAKKNCRIGCIRNGEVTERAIGEAEGLLPEESVSLIAAADGVLYALVSDNRAEYETGDGGTEMALIDPETLGITERTEWIVP
jgi:hypothetical protein